MSPTDTSDTSENLSTSVPAGKVKQTRRRQRLNCVECTRRRQKCDRQIPCGLCVSRGIPQLCRWEPLVARPAPLRPPEGAPAPSQQSTIAALSARIAVLEQTILRQNLEAVTDPSAGNFADTPLPEVRSNAEQLDALRQPTSSSAGSPTPDTDSGMEKEIPSDDPILIMEDSAALSHFDLEVQLAAIKMTQLTLAPSDEYIGSGTVLCAIHKLGDSDSYRFPYSRSNSTTLSNPLEPGTNPLALPIQLLVSSLPPQDIFGTLVDAYFEEGNFKFCIPERWFRNACDQMWAYLDLRCTGRASHAAGGHCSRCAQELNPHWLLLVFAVLAQVPSRVANSRPRMYFLKALEVRRIIEDFMSFSPEYSSGPTQRAVQGVALSCIAAALLCSHFADRGRVSDAWKLSGTALRNAQAVGLHRDPGWYKWENMDRQECELRLLAWWSLVISDRTYSLILGRPTMASEGTYDVKLMPGALNGDGSPNPYVHFEQAFITLMQIIDEVVTKCLGIHSPSYATVLDMDRKFKLWLSKLHPSLDWRVFHSTSTSSTTHDRNLAYQQHMCAAFYLGGLMNLHRPYLMQAPPILPPPNMPLCSATSAALNPSRERCIELAMELVTVLCDAQVQAAHWGPKPQVPFIHFHYAYFVFDGAVALVGALLQEPPHPKARECLALIQRAINMLEACKEANQGSTDGEGDTAARGITILAALRTGGRWDERFGQKERDTRTGNVSPSPQRAQENGERLPSLATSSAPGISFSDSSPFVDLFRLDTSIPFLNFSRQMPSFPFPGPVHVQPSASMPTQFGESRDFSMDASMAAPTALEFGGSNRSMQTMVMPFDMLQNSENFDIDWTALMGSSGWGSDAVLGGAL